MFMFWKRHLYGEAQDSSRLGAGTPNELRNTLKDNSGSHTRDATNRSLEPGGDGVVEVFTEEITASNFHTTDITPSEYDLVTDVYKLHDLMRYELDDDDNPYNKDDEEFKRFEFYVSAEEL